MVKLLYLLDMIVNTAHFYYVRSLLLKTNINHFNLFRPLVIFIFKCLFNFNICSLLFPKFLSKLLN